MNKATEKRVHPRFAHEAAIKHQTGTSEPFYDGRMFNYSEGGLYFETPQELRPGSVVFIGIHHSPYTPNHKVYQCMDGRVKWCRANPGKASGASYGVGVELGKPKTTSP